RQRKVGKDTVIVSTLADGFSGEGDALSLAAAQGAMWISGAALDWSAVHSGERRRRVPLPTYPFERKRFWLETAPSPFSSAPSTADPERAAPAAPAAPAVETVPTEESTTVSRGALSNISTPRVNRLRATLRELFEDLSGVSISEKEYAATFLDLGFDSL